MRPLCFTQQLENPSRANIKQAFTAIKAHERAGNYIEAERIRERVRNGTPRPDESEQAHATHIKLDTPIARQMELAYLN